MKKFINWVSLIFSIGSIQKENERLKKETISLKKNVDEKYRIILHLQTSLVAEKQRDAFKEVETIRNLAIGIRSTVLKEYPSISAGVINAGVSTSLGHIDLNILYQSFVILVEFTSYLYGNSAESSTPNLRSWVLNEEMHAPEMDMEDHRNNEMSLGYFKKLHQTGITAPCPKGKYFYFRSNKVTLENFNKNPFLQTI